MRFVIYGRLAGLNELIASNRSGWYSGSALKAREQRKVTDAIWKTGMLSTEHPVRIHIDWYEKDARRDPDNIFSAIKYILDGLVEMEVIPNDTQKYIKGISNELHIDRENPRVIVEVEALEDE